MANRKVPSIGSQGHRSCHEISCNVPDLFCLIEVSSPICGKTDGLFHGKNRSNAADYKRPRPVKGRETGSLVKLESLVYTL